MRLNKDSVSVYAKKINLNLMDYGKGNEWDGLWSEENEWYELSSEQS